MKKQNRSTSDPCVIDAHHTPIGTANPRALKPDQPGWLVFSRVGLLRGLALLLFIATPVLGRAELTVLHLKNGDRIAGNIISEDTNRVIITTSWIKELSIPSAEIQRRDPATTLPAGALASHEIAPVANGFATPRTTNTPPTKTKHWKIEARAGADFLSGPKNQQIYYGRLKHSYLRPYPSNPSQSFRNVADFAVDYGLTQNSSSGGDKSSVLSANRLSASDKTDFDFGKGRWFVYDLAGLGYDEIRKIDFQYAIGPGLGNHLITRTNFLLNGEVGVDYQEQYRSDKTTTKNVFFRISEDSTWKINPVTTFTERFEFLPRADSTDFRARAEATLSYALWRNVSLHLSMLDLYDTKPAQDVTRNDLQVHTSVGVTF